MADVNTTVFYPDGTLVPNDQVGQAIADGTARWKSTDKVRFVSPNGEGYEVPGGSAWEAIQRGWRPESNDEAELKDAQRSASVGDVLQGFAGGLASTLTFGGYDAFRDPKALRIEKARAPIANELGEVAGVVTPIGVEAGLTRFGVEGAGTLARSALTAAEAATAAPRAVTRFANMAGRAVEAGVSAERPILGAAARQATEGAIEGFTYGTGRELSRQSMGNEDLSLEKLLAAGGEGALFGGALGGGVGALSGVLGKGFTAATTAGRRLEGIANEALAAPAATKAGSRLALEEQQAARAFGFGPGDVQRVGIEKVKTFAREALDRELIPPGLASMFDDMGTKAFKVEKVRQELGEAVGKVYSDLDAAGLKLDRTDMLAASAKQLGEMADKGGNIARYGKQLEKDWVERVVKAKSFEDVAEIVRDLGKEWKKYDRAADSFRRDAITEFRGNLRVALNDEVQRVAPVEAAKLEKLNQLYGAFKEASAVTEKAAARKQLEKPPFTPWDVGVAAAAGFPFGSIYAGTKVAAAGLMRSERAASALAVALNKMRAASANQGIKITDAVEAAARKGARDTHYSITVKRGLMAKNLVDQAMAAAEIQHNPDAAARRIAAVTSPLTAADPKLGARASMTIADDLRWLNSRAPQGTNVDLRARLAWDRYDKFQKAGDKAAAAAFGGKATAAAGGGKRGRKGKAPVLEVTPEAADSFLRTSAALADPISAIAEIKHGSITPEAVDVLAERRPALRAMVEQAFDGEVERLAEKGKELSYETAVVASLATGKAYDPSMRPEMIAAFQATYDERAAAMGAPPPGVPTAAPPSNDMKAARERTDRFKTNAESKLEMNV